MSNDFSNDLITISDESGEEFVFEHVDTIERDGTFYMAFLPTDVDVEDDDYGLVILQVVSNGEEDELITIDDEKLEENLFEEFMDRIIDEEDE